ncbi:hypothetical protein WCT78_03770 [Pectobacterium versatile]|uniref:hypothetical protein n=3 Tax=Pectobacterium versatile TaxID=2488639 RepID=UPI000F64CECA|nr:hypothetical protein [Pectobacterium versatile]AZK62334.1 hypothetical protein EIP93_08485 [Pectobacterium versatile]
MPTFGNMMIPPPNGWEEFESIVKSALELRWRTSNLTMHGRQGQKQNGVDIYGTDDLGRLVGIQCKLTTKSISELLINEEISNAESFQPAISTLYIATTSPSDVNLQKYVRTLSIARVQEGKFSVGILFWNDIIQELTKDVNAVRRHYPQMFSELEYTQPPILDLRQRDIENIKGLFEYIDVESIPYAIEMAPKSLDANFLCASDTFNPIRANPSFYIHDEVLGIKLHSWLDKWYEIICKGLFTYEYQANTKQLIFPMPMDFCRSKEEHDLYDQLEVLYQEYRSLLYDFTNFIHQNYPEINLKETSHKARQWNAQFREH